MTVYTIFNSFSLLLISTYAIFIAVNFISIFPWAFQVLTLSLYLPLSSIELGWTVCVTQKMTTTRKYSQLKEEQILVTASHIIPRAEIVVALGVARGNIIRAKHVRTDIVAGLRNFLGGELIEYTKLMSEPREQANDRAIAHAQEMRADAIVGMRFATSMMTKGSAEILAYGTAVKFSRIE